MRPSARNVPCRTKKSSIVHLHLGGDLERLVGAGRLDRLEVVHHRGIDPGLPHRRHLVEQSSKKRFDQARVRSSMSQ